MSGELVVQSWTPGTQHWLLSVEPSACTALGQLGIAAQCFSTVLHTAQLGFAQLGKHSSLTPPPNSRVKLVPGVVTPVCVKPPILGAVVSNGDAPAGAGATGQSHSHGCVCAVSLRKQPWSAPAQAGSSALGARLWEGWWWFQLIHIVLMKKCQFLILCCVSSRLPAEPLTLRRWNATGQEHLQQGQAVCAGLAQSWAGSHLLGGLWARWSLCPGCWGQARCPVGTREGRGTVLTWGQETSSCAGCILHWNIWISHVVRVQSWFINLDNLWALKLQHQENEHDFSKLVVTFGHLAGKLGKLF